MCKRLTRMHGHPASVTTLDMATDTQPSSSGRKPPTAKQPRLGLRRAIIAAITIPLASGLAAAWWLHTHPDFLRETLNARLPADVRLIEARGLHVFGIEYLRLELAGTMLTIDDARWRWAIESLHPLRLEPRAARIARLDVELAPPTKATPKEDALLPRFWTSDWWPLLARSRFGIDRLVLRDHDATELLAGRIMTFRGGNGGKASFDTPTTGSMRIEWHPVGDAARRWQARLQPGDQSPLQAQGTLEVQFDPVTEVVAWKLATRMSSAPMIPGLQAMQLDASGSANPFAADSALLTGRLQASVDLETPAGTAHAQCTGLLSAAQSLAAVASVESCSGRIAEARFGMQIPMLLTMDSSGTARSLATAGGTLQLDAFGFDAWTMRTLRLTTPAAIWWQSGKSTISVPHTEIVADLLNADEKLLLGLNAHIEAAEVEPARPTLQLAGAVQLRHDTLQLQALDARASLAVTAGGVDTRGSLAHSTIGRLLEWQIAYARHDATLNGELSLDSRTWNWHEGLFHSLLGARQTLFPGDLRAGEIRARLRLGGTAGDPELHMEATLDGLSGTVGNLAFVDLDCDTARFDWKASRLLLRDEVHCSTASINAGIVLQALHTTLRQSPSGWQLHDTEARLLGGSISIATTDISASGETIDTTASLRGIDLAQIAALLDEPALTISGKLDGELPLSLEKGAPILRKGKVHSSAPGLIRYRPATPPEQESAEIALTRKALSNLEFDTLEATLDYQPDGMLNIDAAIRGRNPEFDPRRPVHLNLTLETNLRTLMRSLSAGDRINAWLEKHL